REVPLALNLEMAATEEMQKLALKYKPHAVCLVPEKREELTTEGGLDAARLEKTLTPFVGTLQDAGMRVSLFIDALSDQVNAAHRIGARAVELHTGSYCHKLGREREEEFEKISEAAMLAQAHGMEVHAGHGLNFDNVGPIASIPEIIELNIGHFLIGESMFCGLKQAIYTMRGIMNNARA